MIIISTLNLQVSTLLHEQLLPTNKMVQDIVRIELSYINTNHPDFTDGAAVVSSMLAANDVRKRRNLTSSPHPPDENGAMNASTLPSETTAPSSRNGAWITGYLKGDTASVMGDADLEDDMRSIDLNQPRNRELTDRENMDSELIQRLIRSYFNIIRKNVQDSVPKSVMCFLVDHVKTKLQSVLVAKLYRPELLDDLLSEAEQVHVRRTEAAEMLEALQRSAAIIGEIRDAHVW